MLWEPGNNIGAGLVNVPGASCWNELAAADLDVASPRARCSRSTRPARAV